MLFTVLVHGLHFGKSLAGPSGICGSSIIFLIEFLLDIIRPSPPHNTCVVLYLWLYITATVAKCLAGIPHRSRTVLRHNVQNTHNDLFIAEPF